MSERPGDIHLQHFRDQLAEQRDRKKELERRGQAVVVTNGAIVTLVFAFTDISFDTSTGGAIFVTVLLGVSLILLLWSAGWGLTANMPGQYGEADVDVMKQIAADDAMWADDGDVSAAQQGVAQNITDIIGDAKGPNEDKGRALGRAVRGQVLGLIALAVTLLAYVVVTATADMKEAPVSDTTESTPAESAPSPSPPTSTPSAPQSDTTVTPRPPMYGDLVHETKSKKPADVNTMDRIAYLSPEDRTR